MTLARRIIPAGRGRRPRGERRGIAGLRDMGDPEELAARDNREGADELIRWILRRRATAAAHSGNRSAAWLGS